MATIININGVNIDLDALALAAGTAVTPYLDALYRMGQDALQQLQDYLNAKQLTAAHQLLLANMTGAELTAEEQAAESTVFAMATNQNANIQTLEAVAMAVLKAVVSVLIAAAITALAAKAPSSNRIDPEIFDGEPA
jgi:hypothetical protein